MEKDGWLFWPDDRNQNYRLWFLPLEILAILMQEFAAAGFHVESARGVTASLPTVTGFPPVG
jgi:hypothetical protein